MKKVILAMLITLGISAGVNGLFGEECGKKYKDPDEAAEKAVCASGSSDKECIEKTNGTGYGCFVELILE